MKQIIGSILVYAVVIGLTSCRQPATENKAQAEAAKWEKLGPGGGGATFIPTFAYETPDHFMVRCDMTGSYLTRNGGFSYDQINFSNGASSYAYDPNDPNTIYIGATALHRSTDGGKTWEQIFPLKKDVSKEIFQGDHGGYSIETTDTTLYNRKNGHVGFVRLDARKPDALYFSMGADFFYSDDRGKTLKKEQLPQRIDFIYAPADKDSNSILVFTSDAVHTFNTTTHTFEHKDLPKEMAPAFSFTGGATTKGDETLLYALHHDPKEEIQEEFGHTEVWTSVDLGGHWTRLTNPELTNDNVGIKPSYSMIACAENDAEKTYLVSNRYEEKKAGNKMIYWYGAMKTADAGKHWEWVWKGGGGSGQYGVKDGIGVTNLKDAWAEKAFGGEYIRLMDVGVYPKDGNVAVVTDWYRTMKTTDGGKTWNEIYSASQPDGTFISRGLDVTNAYGVHFDPFDSSHIAISYTDIGYHHSYNGGKSWIRSTEGVPTEWINTCYWMVFDPQVKDKVWSVWSGLHDFPRGKMTRNPAWKSHGKGGVCVSLDGGKTWKPTNEGMGFDSPSTCIVMDPNTPAGQRTLYVSVYGKGVYKSIDDGKTWTLKNKGIGENTCAFELTLAGNGNLYLTVSPTPMHKGGKTGREFYSGDVYRSTDGAETWTRLKVNDGPLFPNGMDYDREHPNRIYLAGWSDLDLADLVGGAVARSTGGNELIKIPGGIFMSEDAGETWTSIFDKTQYVYDVTVDADHPGRLYCNTFNQAAYRSDDYGKTWKKIKGYDFHWGQRAIVDPHHPGQIYLTTYGSSVLHGTPETE
ncbi:sialidase family protein [Chryseolinea serpens]|nr:sialidase family protein [Chryseolinea serpens]